MSVTATFNATVKRVLDFATANVLADVLRKVKLGTMLLPRKITFASLTAAATVDITTAASFAAATISPALEGDDARTLPPIGWVKTLRVTASGTANSVGSYAVSDAGGTALSPTAGANVGLALLSDDGKSLTFPTTITGFVIEYVPRSYTDMTDVFESST